MSLVTSLSRVVVDGSLGVWFGVMAFFSFVAAPRAFSVLGSETAGPYVNEVFPTYYVVGVALGVLALLGTAALGAVGGFSLVAWVTLAASAVATLAHAYARWSLVPKMDAAGDDAFEQYHTTSVRLNAVAMLAVVVAFLAIHF